MPRPRIQITLMLMFILIIFSCASEKKQETQAEPQSGCGEGAYQKLLEFMTGSFSSLEQALDDSSFFDIRLEMVPIWKERSDGYWLYVEQAVASHLSRPYRQRVYFLQQLGDTAFESIIYEMPEPEKYANQWRTEKPLGDLTPDSLIVREGCSIIIQCEGDSVFVGSTVEDNCKSNYRGASYATSEVRITSNTLYSWDRGFDSTDTQIWGAAGSGYIFNKITKAENTE